MDSYVIHVYRRTMKAGTEGITGIVEVPARNERTAFHNLAELESILLSGARLPRPPSKKSKSARRKR